MLRGRHCPRNAMLVLTAEMSKYYCVTILLKTNEIVVDNWRSLVGNYGSELDTILLHTTIFHLYHTCSCTKRLHTQTGHSDSLPSIIGLGFLSKPI
jgi:hypothetical protein